MKEKKQEYITGLMFLLPALFVYLVFWIYPFVYTFFLSFDRWLLLGKPVFIGVQHYIDLANDSDFLNAFKNTLVFTVASVPLFMAVSLSLAVLINRSITGIGIFRIAYYIPVVTSMVAVGVIWSWLYDVDYGLFNSILTKIGLPGVLWISSRHTALASIVLVHIWQYVGFYMVIYLAGLQSIPQEYYEVARIDGAGPWIRLRHITLPCLSEVTFLVLIASSIRCWRMFALVHVMTEGGPLGSTQLMLNFLYDRSFKGFQMGYGAAIAVIMYIFLFLLTFIQYKARRRA